MKKNNLIKIFLKYLIKKLKNYKIIYNKTKYPKTKMNFNLLQNLKDK